MASSKNDIVNMALGRINIRQRVTSIDTDSSIEAGAARTYYNINLSALLRSFAWPFAFRTVALAQVGLESSQSPSFTYRYPADCQLIIDVYGDGAGFRFGTAAKAQYFIGSDDIGQLIFTDIEEAYADYIRKIENVSEYPDDFVECLSWRLAKDLCLSLDKPAMVGVCMNEYKAALATARKNASHEQRPNYDGACDILSVR